MDRKKLSLWKSPNFRLSLSLSTILLLHRILFRFFTRLRAHLLTPEARPFRLRNKKTSKTLTSNLAPAIGASLAGFMLAAYPSDQLRVTIAIYTLSRAAEFAYNLAEDEGWIWGKKERPWWWGSWLIFPLTCGQLLHAFVFDRDCFPKVCTTRKSGEDGGDKGIVVNVLKGIRRFHHQALPSLRTPPTRRLPTQSLLARDL